MGFFWTNQLADAVTATAPITTGPVDVTIMLLARSPQMLSPDTRFSFQNVTTPQSLVAMDGWEEVSDPSYTRQVNANCTIYTSGVNQYLVLGDPTTSFTLSADTQVEAMALLVDGTELGVEAGPQVIFATTSPFARHPIFRNGDSITALVDTVTTKKWFLGWSTVSVALPSPHDVFSSAAEGTSVLWHGPPKFESTRLQHVWLMPQRVNYIANPSFEHAAKIAEYVPPQVGRGVGTALNAQVRISNAAANAPKAPSSQAFGTAFDAAITPKPDFAGFWQTNADLPLVRQAGTAGSSDWVGFAGKTTWSPTLPQYDHDSRLYIRSAAFYPLKRNLTFQLLAKGTGIARVAVAYYPKDYGAQVADWGLRENLLFEEWTLASDHFTNIRGLRFTEDQCYEAALLIEVRGYLADPDDTGTYVPPSVAIDQCLIEEGELLDWTYFDGDTHFAATGDYSWYGGASQVGKSYSLWYNNRNAIAGRLFGRFVDDDSLYTNRDEQLDSLLSNWVPSGTAIVPHWDVLKPNDTQLLPQDRHPAPLSLDILPEDFLPFEIFSVSEASTTSAVLSVIGEGGSPVTRGFVYTESTGTVQPLTIEPRPWEAPGLRQYEIDALKAELYDLSKAQEITIDWGGIPAFSTNYLYLERGTGTSPQAFVTFTLVSSATAGYDESTGVAEDATVDVSPRVLAAAATGTASNAVVTVSAAASAATASSEVFSPGTNATTRAPETAAATGAGQNGTLDFTYRIEANAAAATGAGSNAATNASTTATDAAATGTASDASALLEKFVPADAATASSAATTSTTTVDTTANAAAASGAAPNPTVSMGALAEAAAAVGSASDLVDETVEETVGAASATGVAYNVEVSESLTTVTTGLGTGGGLDASCDITSAVSGLIATSVTSTTATIDWTDAVVTFPAASGARYEVQVGTWTGPDANGDYTPLSTTAVGYATGTDSFINVSGLDENISYSYGVRTHNANGVLSAWKVVTFTASNANPTFTGPSLSVASLTTINVSWTTTETDIASWDVACTGQTTQTGLASGTRSTSFTGLAYSTSYTVTVTTVDSGGLTTSQNASITTGANPDVTAPQNPTLVSFQPETSYGRMVFRWTYPADTDLTTMVIQRSTNGTTWVQDGAAINAIGLEGTAGSRAINGGTAYTSGQTVYVRTIVYDNANGNTGGGTLGNSRTSGTLSTYTLIAAQVFVAATGISSWRNTSGGQWNAAGNSRAYQGYFSDPNWNYRGFYFYSNGISAYYNSGRRTCTSMRQLLIRAGDTGSSAAHTAVMALHKTVSRPADATGVASPALFGSQTSTGLSLGFSASSYWTLPTAWRDGLLDGTYEGLLHYDSSSPVYAAYASLAENGFSGLIEINTLG
jgi:hypothetical protein